MDKTYFTRRHFLGAEVALGSAALLSAQSPNDSVRVGFIGVGNRGSFLLRANRPMLMPSIGSCSTGKISTRL